MSAPGRARKPASPKRFARRRGEGGRGFTLIELLVSTAVVVLVVGAIAMMAPSVREGFDRGLSASELVSRGRTAVVTVMADAGDAGSGVVIGPRDATLADVMPVLVPWHSLDDQRLVPPFSAVAVTRATGAQGLLRDRVEAGAASLRLDTSEACTEQDGTCGLRPGDVAVLYDRTRAELITLVAVTPESATLHLAAPVAGAFDPGAVAAAVQRTAYGLRDDRAGSLRLVKLTGGGAEQPIADRVSAFEVATDVDLSRADLRRVRRLDVYLRLEPLATGGVGLELRTSVALRQ